MAGQARQGIGGSEGAQVAAIQSSPPCEIFCRCK
jgi:hypothetical protein